MEVFFAHGDRDPQDPREEVATVGGVFFHPTINYSLWIQKSRGWERILGGSIDLMLKSFPSFNNIAVGQVGDAKRGFFLLVPSFSHIRFSGFTLPFI